MSVNDASRIIIDNSRVMLHIVASLTDYSKGIIYNCNMFIVQATVTGSTNEETGNDVTKLENFKSGKKCFNDLFISCF
jgi:hypothetical protein